MTNLLKNKEFFADNLKKWYQNHQRDLPWRNNPNPYHIWLSEVILQQTRVKQGLPYYYKFIENFPKVEDLANASEQEVLRLWQGLGYYSRARNLHQAAKMIVEQFGGVFPNTYAQLRKLKGVGVYTASAVASFAFDERVAVVDGNVYRVLARVLGEYADIASPKGQKIFAQLAQQLLPDEEVATYNQAIMEFGALQCTPAKPNCMFCPLQSVCMAFHTNKQQELPIKNQNIRVKERFFNYLVFVHQGELAMKQRHNQDVWGSLYDFMLIETPAEADFESLMLKENFLENATLLHISKPYKHILTHQKIWAKFWQIEAQPLKEILAEQQPELQFFPKTTIENLPKPILIEKYLQKHFF